MPLVNHRFSHVEYGGIIEGNNAAIGPLLKVEAYRLALLIVSATKIVANSFNIHVEFVRNNLHAAIGEIVLYAA